MSVCVCVVFYCVGVYMYGFCNVCVCMGFVVCVYVGFVMCGFCNVWVYVYVWVL